MCLFFHDWKVVKKRRCEATVGNAFFTAMDRTLPGFAYLEECQEEGCNARRAYIKLADNTTMDINPDMFG